MTLVSEGFTEKLKDKLSPEYQRLSEASCRKVKIALKCQKGTSVRCLVFIPHTVKLPVWRLFSAVEDKKV